VRPPTLKASNFEVLWPTNSIFLALKDIIPFLKYTNFQRSCTIFRVSFALSKTPHLQRSYLLTVRKGKSMTVSVLLINGWHPQIRSYPSFFPWMTLLSMDKIFPSVDVFTDEDCIHGWNLFKHGWNLYVSCIRVKTITPGATCNKIHISIIIQKYDKLKFYPLMKTFCPWIRFSSLKIIHGQKSPG